MWWLIAMSSATAAPCERPEDLAEQALASVVEARLEASRELLDRTVSAWACGPQAKPSTVARYWLAEAALASFSDDRSTATEAFVAARRADAELWDERLGSQLRDTWEQVTLEAESGTLILTPQPPAGVVLDGTLAEGSQLQVSAGLHLLQVLDPSGTALFAKVLHVSANQDAVVRTGLSVLPPEPEPVEPVIVEPAQAEQAPAELPDPPPSATSTTPVWLVAAGTAAVVGTAGAIAARGQRSAIESANTIPELDSALGQQKLMAGIAYAGAGVAVVSVGLHFGLGRQR